MADDFRTLFRSLDETDAAAIDTKAVIRRARRRRLPAQVAVGGAFTLALGGLIVGVGAGLGSIRGGSADSAGSAASAAAPEIQNGPEKPTGGAAADASGLKRAPAEKINLCGGTVADVAPSATGLVLTPHFASVDAGAASVDGTVTMTNTGTETVTGSTASTPAITLSKDGVVLWHSNGPTTMEAVSVDLAPGASMEYPATLVPVQCGVEDDEAESFRDDLLAVPAGNYDVSAAIDLSTDSAAELVTGPLTGLTVK